MNNQPLSTNIKIMSYNSTGLGDTRIDFIRDLINVHEVDILLLQETWLLSTNIHRLSSINKDYLYCAVSGVNEEQLLRGRPYGGTAILWKKDIAGFVKPVVVPGCKRATAVTVECTDLQLLVINCYMPNDNYSKINVSDDFLDVTDSIECMINKYPSYSVLLGGDLNLDTKRGNAHDKYYSSLLLRTDMVDVWDLPGAKCQFTYSDHQSRSCIDRFAISSMISTKFEKAAVIHSAVNPSNHQPIFVELGLSVGRTVKAPQATKTKIAWYRVVDNTPLTKLYCNEIDRKIELFPIRDVGYCFDMNCKNMDHKKELDVWCEDLIKCCLDSDHVFPRTKSCQGVKPGWNEHVKQYREENLFWFNVWCQTGKPGEGVIYNNMKESKRQYFYAVRRIKRHEKSLRLEYMSKCISENKSRDFFTEIKKMYPKSGDSPCINAMHNAEDIAEYFGIKYKELYNSVNSSQRDLTNVYGYIEKNLTADSDCYFNIESVVKAVKSLKKNKTDGDRGYDSNHLIYASYNYYVQLTSLINSMLVHGHQPSALLLATIVSVPKDNRGNLCTDSNYRGIALSSCIGKVLDKLFISRNAEKLSTSDLQFAYKEKLSTSMCTLAMKEIIKYYMDNNTKVYSCLIDASKAFDKVHHDKLFQLMIDRGVSAVDMRLLLDLYERQCIRASWKGSFSDHFGAVNGIRQGSIASPILFCCYMDELIRRLKESGIGCWLGNHYAGCLSYADDMTLLCPTITGLQNLVKICEQYAREFGMTYNAEKSVCILFSRDKHLNRTLPEVRLEGKGLSWQKNVKHLGNYLSCDLSEAKDFTMKRSDLIGRSNTVIGNLSGLTVDIISKVFTSKCCHFYGTQIWDFSQHCLTDFTVAWNKCVRRLLCLPNRTHCRFLPGILGSKSPIDQICNMFMKQFRNMTISRNEFVRYVAKRSAVANSIIGINLNFIYKFYGLRVARNVRTTQLYKDLCNEEDKCTIIAIRDLLKGQAPFSNLDSRNFLYYLCIN